MKLVAGILFMNTKIAARKLQLSVFSQFFIARVINQFFPHKVYRFKCGKFFNVYLFSIKFVVIFTCLSFRGRKYRHVSNNTIKFVGSWLWNYHSPVGNLNIMNFVVFPFFIDLVVAIYCDFLYILKLIINGLLCAWL